VTARDTKLGPRKSPATSRTWAKRHSRISITTGSFALAPSKPGDILVGKITPKSETELAPERAAPGDFRRKGRRREDTSLVCFGSAGIIMDVKVSAAGLTSRPALAFRSPRQIKQIQEDYKTQMDKLREGLTERFPTSPGRKDPARRDQRPERRDHHPANARSQNLLRKLGPSRSTWRSIHRR